MKPHLVYLLALFSVADVLLADEPAASATLNSADVEFFEAKIRPVLVEHCYQCHSAASKPVKGGLRLDSSAGTRAGGESGPAVVPNNTDDSLLLSAIRYESFEMPPDKRLPDNVIAEFETWIKRGAADPRSDTPDVRPADEFDVEAGRQFWAFQPPARAHLPDVENGSQRIDVLVEQALAVKAIAPNAAADQRTLFRRLSFDLTGLPPSTEEMQLFINDDSPDAYRQQVERLLAAPAYGERWTRLWLDVARYAEDQAHIVGNNKALFYPNAYRYRDWLIKAFNDDLPYDQFLNLQLAADLLEPDSSENSAALGFIGLGPKYYRRNDPEVMADEWEDRVDVVTRGLLGLTVACARCHNHKYDPIATEDYYALAGIFAGTEMFNKPMNNGDKTDKAGHAKDPDKSLHIVRDSNPTDLEVMIRGDVNNKGDVVHRGFVQVVFPGARREFSDGSGRLELAKCITDPTNPLTARVLVNRIWQQYFGAGIVKTASNFGQLGERPSHPELLDDLAAGFIANGWSLKWLHRQIVLSKTYQRSSDIFDAAIGSDPTNKFLWRMPRRRLSVEGWRDAVLSMSGRLSTQIGGPSVKPDDPAETRRTIYSEVSRFELNPLLSLFDFPDPNSHSAARVETNTPLQKLFLMNSPFMVAQSQAIAEQISGDKKPKQATAHESQVGQLFARLLQRDPDGQELATAITFLDEHPKDGLTQLAQVLLASNEFWFVD